MSYSNKVQGNVGIYWLNSAETWVDTYTASYAKLNIEEQALIKRKGVIWSSESNVMEFVLILSPNPRNLLGKWQTVTGQAPLPPYFSLGYHQSRWSYLSADEVSNVNFRFDFYDLPYDVIWLDIDATNEYEYFTWNPVRFPNVSIEIMNERLD